MKAEIAFQLRKQEMRRKEPIDAYLIADARGLRPQATRLAYASNPILVVNQ
jgi:hypothetical protein